MTHNKTNNIDNQYKSTDSQTKKRFRMAIDISPEMKKEFKIEANRLGISLSDYMKKILLEYMINYELEQRKKGNSLYDIQELINEKNKIIAKEKRKELTAKELERVKIIMVHCMNIFRKDPDTINLYYTMLEEFIKNTKTRYQKV
jgi:SpoVK/Ycf46/Vps4 family AAA+-type ATPase